MDATVKNSSLYTTSIGRKVFVAVSGLFFIVFLLGHLSGNLLLLKGDNGAAFLEYAHFMATTPIIWVSEVFFFGIFTLHIVTALSLQLVNNAARPVKYKVVKPAKEVTFFSRFMTTSGVIMLIFLVLHLWTFFIKHKLLNLHPDQNLYEAVVLAFRQPLYTIFYTLCMGLLSFHLAHGFQSAFQTLGLTVNKRIEARLKVTSIALAVLISGGFASIPLYFLFMTL